MFKRYVSTCLNPYSIQQEEKSTGWIFKFSLQRQWPLNNITCFPALSANRKPAEQNNRELSDKEDPEMYDEIADKVYGSKFFFKTDLMMLKVCNLL